VELERGTERLLLTQRAEALSGADVIGKLAAEIVFEVATRQPGKEVSGEHAEVPDGGELANGPPDVFRIGTEQPWQLAARERCEALGCGALRDLSKIGTPSSTRHVPINALDHRSYDVDQTGISAGVQVEVPQGAYEVG
jgi:hypothetical protein